MSVARESPGAPLSTTLRAALGAGVVCGAGFGVVDALVASRIGTADLDASAWLGCSAGAVFQYVLVWSAGLLGGDRLGDLCSRAATARPGALAFWRIALGIGLFLELYWWTRPYLFYGWNALSPARIATTVGIGIVALLIAFLLARPVERVLRGSRRVIVGCVLLVACAGAIYLYFQHGSIGSRGEKNERNTKVPNAALVVVDAMRQDTLGCYGHERVKSPNIDRLAAEGVVFENAFTQAPFTLTSFGSFLTGKYPRRHGLVSMAPDRRMRRDNVTLPSHLKHACFEEQTGCLVPEDWLNASFHTGAISNGSGLLRGFDLYYEQMVGHGIVIADSPWSVFRSDLLLNLIADKTRTKVKSGVPGVSRDWLAELGNKRFMAMVHLYSTHTPYDPRPAFRDMYVDSAYKGPFKSFYAVDRMSIEEGERTPDAADLAQIRSLYYAGVTQADDDIGKLVELLRTRGALDDTLVIVLSDHGESLGETGLGQSLLLEHDHMVQTNLRIPLVMRWPKGLQAGTRVHALVDEIDLLPTICDLFGLGLPPQKDENSKVDGTSLVPLLTGANKSVREYSFAENGPYIAAQDPRWKLVVPCALLSPEAWTKGPAEDSGEVPWLVDLQADPTESKNVLAEHPDVVERMLSALRAFDAAMPIPQADKVLSPREIEQRRLDLLKNGYVGDEGTPGHKRNRKKSE